MSNYSTESLQAHRAKGDPTADNVIAAIISAGEQKHVSEVFMKLVRNDGYSPGLFTDLPPSVHQPVLDYFEQTKSLPDWADPSLIRQAEEVFSLYGPEIFMLLNVKSLPLCYTCAKGAKVLFETGRLVEHNGKIDPLARRLMETAQMIMNVMQPGGLSAGGKGIVTMQKIRLIHASIRYFLKHPRNPDHQWDVAVYGEPINQEDLAGTLMSFAPVILSGLKQLDISLTDAQIAAYSHCWQVVGHMMGIEKELLPDSFEDGWSLTIAILKDQAAESSDGKALTQSCINFMQYILPGNLFDEVPAFLIRHFMQDIAQDTGLDLAGFIGVDPHENLTDDLALRLTEHLTRDTARLEHSVFIQKLTSHFNKVMLRAFLRHYNSGKGIHFFIPPSLQKDWNLDEIENIPTGSSPQGNMEQNTQESAWKDQSAVTPDILGNRLMWKKKQGN